MATYNEVYIYSRPTTFYIYLMFVVLCSVSAALQKQLPGSTAVVFGETVKKWLKYAPEREGGVPRNA